MYKDSYKQLTFVIYDGINNSVFGSMVLAPLIAMLNADHNLEITLVSFESKKPDAQTLLERIPAHDNLHVVILHRLPFFGKFSLLPGVLQLYYLFKKIPCNEIIARGALAGWIVEKVREKMVYKIHCTIQARGLCAEEYRYANMHKTRSLLKQSYRRWVYNQLKQIECEAYCNKSLHDPNDVIIEAVSPALKEYLIKNFHADERNIIIARKDLPQPIAAEQIAQWRETLRRQLGIMQDAYVYCYSGSYKPWQCADETIHYFSEQHDNHDKTFLLILSPDKQAFIKAITRHKIPQNRYLVLSVLPDVLVQYLAIADAGLLFRQADVINWVSRPTKMLEYQSVGLKIIHNNTIALLCL